MSSLSLVVHVVVINVNVALCEYCVSMCRILPLWFGARGVEFDWKYVQMSLDSNVSLVCEALVVERLVL